MNYESINRQSKGYDMVPPTNSHKIIYLLKVSSCLFRLQLDCDAE